MATKRTHRTPSATSEAVRRRMTATRRRDTPKELAVRRALHARGFRYRVDRAPIVGLRSRADLVFSGARVAVYVHGCFWHRCAVHGTTPKANRAWWLEKLEANRRRDDATREQLERAGWAVEVIWEHEDVDDAVERVALLIHSRTTTPGERPADA